MQAILLSVVFISIAVATAGAVLYRLGSAVYAVRPQPAQDPQAAIGQLVADHGSRQPVLAQELYWAAAHA